GTPLLLLHKRKSHFLVPNYFLEHTQINNCVVTYFLPRKIIDINEQNRIAK
ncbi:hypothetical protein ACJX0J_020877, partial [Zea mays]